jgi:acyl dehydratase
VNAPTAAKNVPLAEPDGIVSEDGTVKLVELEFKPMVPPPGPLSVTVQVLEERGATLAGLQTMETIVVLATGATSESVVD